MSAGLDIPLGMFGDTGFEAGKAGLKEDIEGEIAVGAGLPVQTDIRVELDELIDDGLRIGRDLGGVHGGVVPFFYLIHGACTTVKVEVITFPEIIAGIDAAEGAVFDAPFVIPLILAIGFR